MRFLDRVFTGLLLLILQVPVRVWSIFIPRRLKNKKILCLKFVGLGGAITSLPLLEELKSQGYEVAFWTFKGGIGPLLKSECDIIKIWEVSKSPFHFPLSLFRSWMSILWWNPSLVIDLEPSANSSALFSFCTGASFRLGFDCGKKLRRPFYTHSIKLLNDMHIRSQNLKFAQVIKQLAPQQAEISSITASAQKLFEREQKLPPRLLMNINASDLSLHRLWPETHWLKLITMLLLQTEVRILFSAASNDEKKRVGKILKTLPLYFAENVKHLTKDINFEERIENISKHTPGVLELKSALLTVEHVITVDSGLMHLADYLQVPLTALMGPETPVLYGPQALTSEVFYKGLSCSPCLIAASDKISKCRDNQCMKQIAPEQVFARVQARISKAIQKAA